MGAPLKFSHQVTGNESVRYTLVKSRGKADNIVVEVGGILHKHLKQPLKMALISLYKWQPHSP